MLAKLFWAMQVCQHYRCMRHDHTLALCSYLKLRSIKQSLGVCFSFISILGPSFLPPKCRLQGEEQWLLLSFWMRMKLAENHSWKTPIQTFALRVDRCDGHLYSFSSKTSELWYATTSLGKLTAAIAGTFLQIFNFNIPLYGLTLLFRSSTNRPNNYPPPSFWHVPCCTMNIRINLSEMT